MVVRTLTTVVWTRVLPVVAKTVLVTVPGAALSTAMVPPVALHIVRDIMSSLLAHAAAVRAREPTSKIVAPTHVETMLV